jgi:hypothetical protein
MRGHNFVEVNGITVCYSGTIGVPVAVAAFSTVIGLGTSRLSVHRSLPHSVVASCVDYYFSNQQKIHLDLFQLASTSMLAPQAGTDHSISITLLSRHSGGD